MSHLRRLACLLLLLVALPQALAWAGDTPREKARLLTKTATVLARDGKYDEAVALYEQAWALEPDPILLFNLAVVKQKQGDLVGARDYLQRYLDAETDAKLKEKGALRLATVLAALGTVRIEVDVEGAAVAIDGNVRGATPLPPLGLAAGRHTITVTRAGFQPAERVVDVKGGTETPVLFALAPVAGETPSVTAAAPVVPSPLPGVEPAPAVEEPAAAPATEPIATGVAASSSSAPSSLGTWGWVSAGTGAALLAGGVALTVLATRDRNAVTGAELQSGVVVGLTQARAQQLETRANRETIGSWALYGLGGAALVAGVTFLVWDHALGTDEPSPTVFVTPTADGALAGVAASF